MSIALAASPTRVETRTLEDAACPPKTAGKSWCGALSKVLGWQPLYRRYCLQQQPDGCHLACRTCGVLTKPAFTGGTYSVTTQVCVHQYRLSAATFISNTTRLTGYTSNNKQLCIDSPE